MAFRDHALAGLAALYAEFGRPASWQAAGGGDPVPCTVIRSEPSQDIAFGGSRARMDTDVIEVRVCEVAQVSTNDVVTVQDLDPATGAPVVTVWRVRTEPPRDPAGLVWVCDVAEGADGI